MPKPVPKYGNKEEFAKYEASKEAATTPAEKSAKLESAKAMLDAGQIPQGHYDAIVANLTKK